MRNVLFAAVVVIAIAFMAQLGEKASAAAPSGEELFKQNCSSCHPGGSNIVNPQKTLNKKTREANKVKTADDIVKLMRNPGPGMTKFDAQTVPDKDARKIAEYVIKTF